MEQEQISLISDNECEDTVDKNVIVLDDTVQEASQSVISLDDTVDDSSPQAVVETIDVDMEEGEVTTEDEDLNLVFTVKFESKDDFNIFHEKVKTNLSDAFANDNIDIQIVDPDGSNPVICAYKRTKDVDELEDLNIESLFQIDTAPSKKLDTESVPSYKRAVKVELNEKSKMELDKNNADKCERPKAIGACFNCGSTVHSLRDCPKKRNNSNIQRAKKQHSTKFERYHVDVEQRFSHIKPGVISNEARTALGLQRNELPFIFYRMRVLGYPPAWLEDAQVSNSGIALFNADGTEVLKSDDENDRNENLGESVKYDTSKIIDFPGYNVHPGSKFYDDYRHYGVPAISDLQKKERLIEALGDKAIKGYKRRKLKSLPTAHNIQNRPENIDLSRVDMEIDDPNDEPSSSATVEFTRPPPPPDDPVEKFVPLPPPPPLTSDEIKQNKNDRTTPGNKSPSLEDLQAKQEQLLKQLQGNISADADNLQISASDEDNDIPPNEKETEQNNSIADDSTALPEAHFKASHLGTPLLKFSEFDTLPSDDKFKVGVSDVINFENLPDSTGKYEQMKVVIDTVRKKISKLIDEDD